MNPNGNAEQSSSGEKTVVLQTSVVLVGEKGVVAKVVESKLTAVLEVVGSEAAATRVVVGGV